MAIRLFGRGDSPKLLIVAIILKFGFGLVHYILTGPLLWRIHPTLVIIPLYFYFVSFASLFHAANMDPGVLPKYIEQRTTCPPGLDSDSMELGDRNFYPYMPKDSTDIKFVESRGKEIEIKYCVSCELYRPHRAAHDSSSDECVLRFDHFCIWLNNSIGERNYVFFFWFVILTWLQLLYVLITNLYLVFESKPFSADTIFRNRPTSVALAIAMFFLLFALTGLTLLHCYLVSF
eukprot:NODE_166_length_14584_cov_1.124750.p9 type:complete len:233 gc:universal NODE_166_length_14584_cov_1.124750:9228-9926(+)